MNDPLVERLCTRWRTRSPESAIRAAIYSVFPELSKIEPPVDVQKLAEKRAVTEIRTVSMNADGIISSLKDGRFLIELNENHSARRRRFTCGHEIGHTFFFDLDDEMHERTRLRIEDGNLELGDSNRWEEYLCNVAAAEILMPYEPFSEALRVISPSSGSVLALSRSFGTSLWATARRVVQVCPFKLLIALWEYQLNPERYQTMWIACSSAKGPTRLVVDKSIPIFKTLETSPSFRGRRLASLGGPIDDYFVDSTVLRVYNPRRVLTVFVLDTRAEKLFLHKDKVSSPKQERLFE